MSKGFRVTIALLGGPVLGWYALWGVCEIPGLTTCGHNVIVMVPFFILFGVVTVWFGTRWLAKEQAHDAKRT